MVGVSGKGRYNKDEAGGKGRCDEVEVSGEGRCDEDVTEVGGK